jgi:hypothetical protein
LFGHAAGWLAAGKAVQASIAAEHTASKRRDLERRVEVDIGVMGVF